MTPKRIRPLRASAGLLTALSLGVASLAGCASFDPNPTAPVPPATTAVQPTATTPSTAPVTPPAAAMSQISGQAFAGSKAYANATVTAYNAFTNAPITGLVAAGAGNLVAAGAGNLVAAGAGNYGLNQAGGVMTDAEGNFNFSMPEIAEDQVVRVTVSAPGGAPLSIIVGGSEIDTSASAYVLSQLTKTVKVKKKSTFKIKVNVTSTLTTEAFQGVVTLLGGLNSKEARQQAIAQAVDSMSKAGERLASLNRDLDSGPNFETLARISQAMGEQYTYNGLADALSLGGINNFQTDFFNEIVGNALANVLDLASQGGGFNGTLALSQDDFPEGLEVNLDEVQIGKITFTDPKTGETNVITVDPDLVEVVEVVEEEERNIEDFNSNAAQFQPTVDIVYDLNDPGSPLAMTVTQGAGQNDVKQIVAKIARKWVASVNLDAAAIINDTNGADTTVSGAWSTLLPGAHTIEADSQSATIFSGKWLVGGAKEIATVVISAEPDFVTITLDFNMAGNDFVKTQGGSVRMEALSSIITLDHEAIAAHNQSVPLANNIVEVSVTSRQGTDTVTVDDDTAKEQANWYGRPITVTGTAPI